MSGRIQGICLWNSCVILLRTFSFLALIRPLFSILWYDPVQSRQSTFRKLEISQVRVRELLNYCVGLPDQRTEMFMCVIWMLCFCIL